MVKVRVISREDIVVGVRVEILCIFWIIRVTLWYCKARVKGNGNDKGKGKGKSKGKCKC